MTETLAQKKCTPCRGGVPPLTHEEAERFQSQTPNWDLLDDSHRIERTFRFRNFQEALGFVRNVGDLVETEGHHPDINFGWGYATISLRTKKIKGLHETILSWRARSMGYSIARVTLSVSKVVASSHDDGEQSFCYGFWRNRLPRPPRRSPSP
jgi:4a-hydroxytetrahydrobiopterin dehydratase